MATVSTNLNFAFHRRGVQLLPFGVRQRLPGQVMRFSDMPPTPGQPSVNEEDKNLTVHISLPILGGHMIMGTDGPESMGFKSNQGNSVYINLSPDTRGETDRLSLAEGGGSRWRRLSSSRGDY